MTQMLKHMMTTNVSLKYMIQVQANLMWHTRKIMKSLRVMEVCLISI
uniref:Uncharacterized protein n=1 Tax=Picea sitchensis TaxID=3332 RepID=A9P0W8_PICSI|nr:unknown [Picea sitchensis]